MLGDPRGDLQAENDPPKFHPCLPGAVVLPKPAISRPSLTTSNRRQPAKVLVRDLRPGAHAGVPGETSAEPRTSSSHSSLVKGTIRTGRIRLPESISKNTWSVDLLRPVATTSPDLSRMGIDNESIPSSLAALRMNSPPSS